MSQNLAKLLPINDPISVTVKPENEKDKLTMTVTTNTMAYLWKAALNVLICAEDNVVPSILPEVLDKQM